MIRGLFILFTFSASMGQVAEFPLSQKHIQKIENISSTKKKLKAYRKYYHRDSLRHVREMDKYWKKQSDSLHNVWEAKEKALKQKEKNISARATEKLTRQVYMPWAKQQTKKYIAQLHEKPEKYSVSYYRAIEALLEHYFLACARDDTRLARLRQDAPGVELPRSLSSRADALTARQNGPSEKMNTLKGDVKGRANEKINAIKQVGDAREIKNQAGNYRQQYGGVLQSRDSLSSLRGANAQKMIEDKAGNISEVAAVKKQMNASQEMQSAFDAHKTQAEQLQDSTYLKEQAKKKVQEKAMAYLAENPAIMQGVQAKMNLLMKKYSVVPNSKDLSTATKHTSLKGRTFRERLVWGANFQVLTLDPVSIDFSPTIGYRINKRFVLGVGGTYRQKFSTDSIPQFAPDVLGYKTFTNYDVAASFFLYGEYGRNTPGVKHSESGVKRIWNETLLAGIGRRIKVHRKIDMTVVFAYNFLHQRNDPVYPRPWMVRVGFQTSELAMMKRKPFY